VANADGDPFDGLAQYLVTGDDAEARAVSVSAWSPDRAQLDRVRGLLADDAMWAAPPPELIDQIVDRIDKPPASWATVRGGVHRRWALVGGLSAAAALVVALMVTRGMTGTAGDTGGREVAMSGTELAPEASATAHVSETPSGVSIILRVEGLDPAAEGFYYQAWVKGPAGLVAIGTFHVRHGEDVPVELWSGVAAASYPDFTVTLEPEDGDPASSGQRVLTGSISG
jgi:hypothetical protein